jgi:hypothetical protein
MRTVRAALLGSTALLLLCAPARKLSAQETQVDPQTHRRGCNQPRPLIFAKAALDSIPHCIAHVEVFADGNVKDVLGNPNSTAAASGALGLHYQGSRFEVTGMVNVVGTTDTVRADYGASLLLPTTGQALNAASLAVRYSLYDWNDSRCASYSYNMLCNVGFRVELNASTRDWATSVKNSGPLAGQTDSVSNVVTASTIPMWGSDVGVWYAFFQGNLPSTDTVARPVSMLLDVSWAHRALRGDISGGTASQQATRQALLNTTATNFDGLGVGLTLVFNQVRSNLTYYRFGGAVNGLSGGQIVATVEIQAAFASGLLRRN